MSASQPTLTPAAGTAPIRTVAVSQLKVGVYIHDLNCHWLNHDFLTPQFLVSDEKILAKLRRSGIAEVLIDTRRGIDPTAVEPPVAAPSPPPTAELARAVPVEVERKRAAKIVAEANAITKSLLTDIRLGRQVEIQAFEPVAEQVVASVMRNRDALISLSRIKNKDDYTFMHSVSVSGLLVTFGRSLKFSEQMLHDLAIGGLIHDIGKMQVPNEVLNKPGKLTDDEFVVMKGHIEKARDLLAELPDLAQASLDVSLQHHERYDGSGYPLHLKGEQISRVGAMSAIVDVYDALTSVRIYKAAWEPSLTLKKMLEWSGSHFHTPLLHQFIQCIGIYPTGTLVELESGRVGLVLEQSEGSLTTPRIKIIYSRHSGYLPPKVVDLSREKGDTIVQAIAAEKYRLDPNWIYTQPTT